MALPVQLAVLSDAAGEDLGDQDALEAELERELAAAEEAAEAEGASKPNPHSNKVLIGSQLGARASPN